MGEAALSPSLDSPRASCQFFHVLATAVVKKDLGRKERTRNTVAIPGQNFDNNIGFESEIYSYSVGIQEHCRGIVSNFYKILPTLLPLKSSLQKSSRMEFKETTMPEHHVKIYQKTVVTYLP